jgi:calcineurin-like phosphoesterase family protein
MSNIWLISDTHFGHAAMIHKFIKHSPECPDVDLTREQTQRCACPKVRGHFASVEEMDETMVANWNRVVRPADKVYHLGDVVMGDGDFTILDRLNGQKRLCRGNHDTKKGTEAKFRKYFEAIYGSRLLDKNLVLTHIPVHPDSLRYDWINVHGHTHDTPALLYGPRYFNVCVEKIDYTPIALEDLKLRIKAQADESKRLIDDNLKRMGISRRWTDEELMSDTWGPKVSENFVEGGTCSCGAPVLLAPGIGPYCSRTGIDGPCEVGQ